jgi:hypothetical protein
VVVAAEVMAYPLVELVIANRPVVLLKRGAGPRLYGVDLTLSLGGQNG